MKGPAFDFSPQGHSISFSAARSILTPAIVTTPSSTGWDAIGFSSKASPAAVSKKVALAPHLHDDSPRILPGLTPLAASDLPPSRATSPPRQGHSKLLAFMRSISPAKFTLRFLTLKGWGGVGPNQRRTAGARLRPVRPRACPA